MKRMISILPLFVVLLGVGCDVEEADSAEELALAVPDGPSDAALESIVIVETDAAEDEGLGIYGYTEIQGQHHNMSDALDLAPPPAKAKGLCATGHWEKTGYADFQGCGSCDHQTNGYTWDGNDAYWWKRWCWDGPGCGGCGPWLIDGSQCYDICPRW